MTTYAAGSFTVGNAYTIAVPGTTSFTAIGAANNTAGTSFVATGVGSGSGTAYGTDIQPFALAGGANVSSQASFLTWLAGLAGNSFSTGQIPPATHFNKILRQASFVANGIANWMASQGTSVPDDGNLLNFITEFQAALSTSIAGLASSYQFLRTSPVTPVPVTSDSGIAASHSLGYTPFVVILEYICLTAEQNYSVGDVVEINSIWSGTTSGPLSIWKNTTGFGATSASGTSISLQNKTTGSYFSPTAAYWASRFVYR